MQDLHGLKGLQDCQLQDLQFSVTALAAQKIKEVLNMKDPVPFGIKICVYNGGNSQVNYAMNFVKEPNHEDRIYNIAGINFITDPYSSVFLNNTVLDYVETPVTQGFTFKPSCAGKVCAQCDGSCGRYA